MTRWNRLSEAATILEGLCCKGTMWLARVEPLRASWDGRSCGWERQSEAIMKDALGVSNHSCYDDVMVPSTIKKVRPKGAKCNHNYSMI